MSQCVSPRQAGWPSWPNHGKIHFSFIWLLLLIKKLAKNMLACRSIYILITEMKIIYLANIQTFTKKNTFLKLTA